MSGWMVTAHDDYIVFGYEETDWCESMRVW